MIGINNSISSTPFKGRLHVIVDKESVKKQPWKDAFYDSLLGINYKVDYLTPKNSDFYIKANSDGLAFKYVTDKHAIKTAPLMPDSKHPIMHINTAVMALINAGEHLERKLHSDWSAYS